MNSIDRHEYIITEIIIYIIDSIKFPAFADFELDAQ